MIRERHTVIERDRLRRWDHIILRSVAVGVA